MSRNSTHINCNQIAGTVNQGIWLNDCDPCAECAHTIPNLQQWLRQKFNVTAGGTLYADPAATATIVNGTAVSQWNDEIGTNNATQGTGANQPVWDSTLNALTFDNTDSLTFTNTTYAAGDDFTILLGFTTDNAGTFPYALWNGDSGNDSIAITSNTEVQIVLDGTSQTITGPAITPSTGQCDMLNWVLRRENDTCQLFLAGMPWGPSFMWAGDYEVDTIGVDPIGGSGLNGNLTNFMQFDRDLTNKEIWCLECYLCGDDTEEECVGCRIDEFKLDCHGDTNGTLTAVMTGATGGAVTYAWSPGGWTTQTISSLGVGSYTCVMTDVGGTDLVTTCVGEVTEPLVPFSCTITGIDPYYGAGGALVDGSVNVVTAGGWGSTNTYTWTVPATAAAIGNVASSPVQVPGTYSVSVTNSEGCTTTCQVVIDLDTPTSLDIECCIGEPQCHGDDVYWYVMMDASATYPVTISFSCSSSGVPGWSAITVPSHPADSTLELCDPHTGPWVAFSGAGQMLAPDETWTITVADSGSGASQRTQTCQSTPTSPTQLDVTLVTVQPTYCQNGYSNGTITGSATGGTGSYTWEITDGTTTWSSNALSSVAPGTYTITVTDSLGCTDDDTVTIACPMDPLPTIDHVVTDASCQEFCDGSISWTPSVQTYTGYTFSLVVYDAGGSIIHNHGPVASFPSPHVLGGTVPFLCPGNYTYNYTAKETATGTVTPIATAVPFTINQPNQVLCDYSVTQMQCVGQTSGASITVTSSGGTGVHTIAWTGPGSYTATTFTITGLTTVGMYNYVVTDANGCTCQGSVYVKDGCTFDVTLSAEDIDCTGAGSVTEYLVNGIFDLNTMQGPYSTNIYNDSQFYTTGSSNAGNTIDNFFDNAQYSNSSGMMSSGLWYMFETSTVGTNQTLTYTAGSPNMICGEPEWGMAQWVNGLTVGNTYTIEVIIDAASFTAGDEWDVKMYADNGTAFVAAAFATGTNPLTTSGLHTLTFVATAVDMHFTLNYDGAAPGSATTTGWNRLFDQTSNMKLPGSLNSNLPEMKGKSVAMSANGRRVLVGSPGMVGSGLNIGRTTSYDLCCGSNPYTFPYTGCQWAYSGIPGAFQMFSHGDAIGDRHSIDISDDGDTCVIGMPYCENTPGHPANADYGKVTVYTHSTNNATTCAGNWEQKGSIIMNPNFGDGGIHEDERFGQSVAISGDGLTVVIGAPGFDSTNPTSSTPDNFGQVYVYVWDSGTSDWVQKGGAVLDQSLYGGVGPNDEYGFCVAVSTDGNEFMLGAPGQSDLSSGGAGWNSGAILMYEWNSGASAWRSMGVNGAAGNVAPGATADEIDGLTADEFFGSAVAMSGDGQRVVGCSMVDPTNTAAGTCRVYDYNSGTTTWTQVGSDIEGVVNNGQSGCSVDMTTDGSIVVIGAYQEDTNDQGAAASNAGSVRVYKDISGTWTLQGDAINGENTADMFGFDVAINGDGTMIAAGAPFNNGDMPGNSVAGLNGAAYIYEMTTANNNQVGNGCVTYTSLTGQNPAINTTDIFATANPCGTAPFTYNWSATLPAVITPNLATDPSLLGIGAGDYSLTITDANGCTDTEAITIAAAGSITNSITVVSNVLCDGTLGALESDNQFPGGTYLWTTDAAFTLPVTGSSTGYQTYEIDNQPAGTYYLQIVDVNGCTWDGSATITDPGTGMTLEAVVVDADMCGDCCGSITLTVTGGTGPFTFLWTGPGGPYTTQDLDCLQPGSYTVVVTDANGCQETGTWTVAIGNDPINFQLQTNTTAGTISTVNLSGGTPNYNWVWTGPGGFTASGSVVSAVIPDIYPTVNGIYCLTVIDSYVPDACEQTHCIDWTGTRDPVLGYNCVQNYEDSCEMVFCDQLFGPNTGQYAGGENFGWMLDLSGDGTTIAIGSPAFSGGEGPGPDDPAESTKREYYKKNNSAMSANGKVTVWTLNCDNKPVRKGQILFGDTNNAHFGQSVAMSTDGNKLTVGAPGAGSNKQGKVHHYIYSAGNWVPKAAFTGVGQFDGFGKCVSQAGTGLHFAVAAHKASSGEGTVTVFETNGFTWSASGNQIVGTGGSGNEDELNSVALSNDGTRLIVGAPQEETSNTPNHNKGLAKCYLNVSGTWTQVGSTIWGNDGEWLGHSVSISHDGLTVAVSAHGKDVTVGGNEGAIRVYRASDATTSASWNQLGGDIDGIDPYDTLGRPIGYYAGGVGVKLSSDGETLIASAESNNNNGQAQNTGAYYVYKLIDGAWIKQCDTIYGDQGTPNTSGDHFGSSVSISDDGTKTAAGAYAYDNGPTNQSGMVKVHNLTYTTGSTTDHITDGTNFSTTFGAATTGDFATAIATVDAIPAVVGTWYPFSPTGVSAPTASGGSVNLTLAQGIIQKVSGLTIGHIYDIKVNATTTMGACNGHFLDGVGTIRVYNGTTLANTPGAALDGVGDTTIQYTATATTATIMISDNGNTLAAQCELDINNVTMKQAQYQCDECTQAPCDFATMQDCIDEPCGGDPIAASWDCQHGQCKDPGTGNGQYSTLNACLDAEDCGRLTTRWNCAETGCYPVSGQGTYPDEAACLAVCTGASRKFYCEILCPDADKAQKYKDDDSRDEKYDERQREDVTGGGRCRMVEGTESPSIPSHLQYDDIKTCSKNCPWCKEGEERDEY